MAHSCDGGRVGIAWCSSDNRGRTSGSRRRNSTRDSRVDGLASCVGSSSRRASGTNNDDGGTAALGLRRTVRRRDRTTDQRAFCTSRYARTHVSGVGSRGAAKRGEVGCRPRVGVGRRNHLARVWLSDERHSKALGRRRVAQRNTSKLLEELEQVFAENVCQQLRVGKTELACELASLDEWDPDSRDARCVVVSLW